MSEITKCSTCGKTDRCYQCDECRKYKCWACGLKSADGNRQAVEPDPGLYVCAACQCGCATCTSS